MTNLETIAASLEQARQDLEMAERLASAEERVSSLEKAYAAAEEDAEAARAEALKAEQEARFAGLSNIKVSNVTPPASGKGLLHQTFRISYTRKSYNSFIGANQSADHSVTSFAALPSNVLEFLLVRHPEEVPTEILALAPNSPGLAVEFYLSAKRRGYLTVRPEGEAA